MTFHGEQGVKLCSRCGINPAANKQRYCAPCRKDYMRAWRNSKRQLPVPPDVKQGDIITYYVGKNGRIKLLEVRNA